ncbi:hypothetical protein BFZC1_20863 [Lysinibacillus fusiformis ZC1]|nr:hypothetical protein BFZC1_20863 [Lysinibacillus fusiformis ZC1]
MILENIYEHIAFIDKITVKIFGKNYKKRTVLIFCLVISYKKTH